MRRVYSALLLISATCAALLPPFSFASDARNFNIRAGSATSGIEEFATQSGMSVVYDPGLLDGYAIRGINKRLEPEKALRLMLRGSGLGYTLHGNAVVIHRERSPASPTQKEDLPTVNIGVFRSAGLADLPPGVTVRIISGEELSRQGFTTVPEWVESLPENQGTGAYEGTSYLREAPTNIAYGSGMNLFGLGQRSTLILINGHRLAPGGSAGSYADVTNLPLSAIDHIELISNAAATRYGADAAAGIVNFVLQNGQSRPQTLVSLGNLTKRDLAGNNISQSIVGSGRGWQALGALDFYDRSGLPAAERRQATTDLTAAGGTNYDTLFGNPANVIDAAGHPWGIPAGQNGTQLTAEKLLPHPNLYDQLTGTWILPQQRRVSALFDGSWQWDNTKLTFDSSWTRRIIDTHLPPMTATLSVPDTNPFYINPIAGNHQPVNVLYGFGSDFGPITEHGKVDSGQLGLRLAKQLNPAWIFQIDSSYAFDNQLETRTNLVSLNSLQAFLASSNPAVAFNAFGAGSNTNPETLAAIHADGSQEYRSAVGSLDVEATGLVALLPAGPASLTTGYQLRFNRFGSAVSRGFGFTDQPTSREQVRRMHAAYLQAGVPVLGGGAGSGYRLGVSVGGRYEHFSDAGSAFLPGLGFQLSFNGGIVLTGAVTKMFRPPNLPDLDESPNYAAEYSLSDPQSTSGYSRALILGGNNSGLQPETARSSNLGLRYSPPSDPDLTLDLNYFNIVSSHQVQPAIPLMLNALSDPQYAYLVSRDASPAMTAELCSRVQFLGAKDQCGHQDSVIVDLRLHSTEALKTSGFDFGARDRVITPIGSVSLSLRGTYVLNFAIAPFPGAAWISYRNTPHNPPALRLRGVLGWEERRLFASAALNLKSGYQDTFSAPTRPVSSWMTWDLTVGYRLDALHQVFGGDTVISLRGFNIGNKQPPFLNNSVGILGYDPENADLLGRRLSLRLAHRW